MGIKFSKVTLGAGLDSCSFFIPGHPASWDELQTLLQYRKFCREHPEWDEIEVEGIPFWFGENHRDREGFRDADTDHLLLMASFGSLYGGWRDDPATYPLVRTGSAYRGTGPNPANLEGTAHFDF